MKPASSMLQLARLLQLACAALLIQLALRFVPGQAWNVGKHALKIWHGLLHRKDTASLHLFEQIAQGRFRIEVVG